MPSRPYLSLLAMAGALLGATIAANAQSYPLPTAPPGATAPNAQPAAPGALRPHHNRLRMALRSLTLSSDQRGQIRAAFQQFRASRTSATPMTRRQLRGQIEGVLTPAQRGQLRTWMQQHPPAPLPAAS